MNTMKTDTGTSKPCTIDLSEAYTAHGGVIRHYARVIDLADGVFPCPFTLSRGMANKMIATLYYNGGHDGKPGKWSATFEACHKRKIRQARTKGYDTQEEAVRALYKGLKKRGFSLSIRAGDNTPDGGGDTPPADAPAKKCYIAFNKPREVSPLTTDYPIIDNNGNELGVMRNRDNGHGEKVYYA